MRRSIRRSLGSGVAVALAGGTVALGPAVAHAAPGQLTASLVQTINMAGLDPPSPDSAGIVYIPREDRLIVSDSEVNETPLYAGANLFTITRQGALQTTGNTLAFSDEPTGLGYDAARDLLLVSDDDDDQIYLLARGGDGLFGTADDPAVSSISTRSIGNRDAEDAAVDATNGDVYVVDGVGSMVYRYARNGSSFTTAGTFDVSPFAPGQAMDPEGIDYDPVTGHLFIVDSKTEAVYEAETNGTLVNVIDISAADSDKAASVAVAPASSGSGRNLYIAARGIDNDSNPDENDGKVFEMSYGATGGNQPPVVDAGPDQTIVPPDDTADLDGSVTDTDGPNATPTVTWSKDSGPGTVTFATASAASTTATFSAAGTYVLRLVGDDGAATGFDLVSVTVESNAPGNAAPTASAGDDQTVTMSAGATLAGSITDDGLPNPPAATTAHWRKSSGPRGGVQFADRTSLTTSVTFTRTGTYTLLLTAGDSALTGTDEVVIRVTGGGAANAAPVADAGPDITVSRSLAARLNGSGTDDGLPNPPARLTYKWSEASGPGIVTWVKAHGGSTSAITRARFSRNGTYELRLKVSDSKKSDTDLVTVRVTS